MAMQRKDFHPENYKHLNNEELQLTRAEKRANWWHYHKWHVLIGGVLVVCALDITKDVLHIGETSPDYQIAYVGSASLPEDTVTALEDFFASIGEDLNGDGKIVVELHDYADNTSEENSDGAYYQYASEVSLMADIEDCESFFFLLEDPESFEQAYDALAYLDGSLPEENAKDYENMYLAWTDSSLLAAASLGDYTTEALGVSMSGSSDELVSSLYLARRGFWNDSSCQNQDGCETLWEKILEER